MMIPSPKSAGIRLRHKVPHLSCGIIKSGTSRFVVLRDDELPKSGSRHKLILDLLANAISTDGVGGRHYQSNKVAVIGKGRGEASFTFHFYQVMPESRRLFSKMECSNAATVSALLAMLLGVVRKDRRGVLRSVNLATNQFVELTPSETCWDGDWGVRFTNLHHIWFDMTRAVQPFRFTMGGVKISGAIFRHGNVFVMTRLPVEQATPEIVAALGKRGEDFAKRTGHSETLPKVLIYDPEGQDGRVMDCHATCFSEGQQHHSLPGSGAMALGAFLTAQGHLPLPEKSRTTSTVFRFTHPSGTLKARVHLFRSPSHWQIDSTSFETPVRLLLHGNIIPR